jgi:hypothetical protein
MTDLRQPAMEEGAQEVSSGTPHRGNEFLRRSIARSLHVEKRRATLEHAVEFEIVPRLLLAHQSQAQARNAPTSATGVELTVEIKAFADMILGRDEDAARTRIQSLRAQGIAMETIYLGLLSPAARYLKYQWIEDERDFAEVALGFWKLQQLLRELGTAFCSDGRKPTGLRVLLTTGPGEPQDLGYLMFGLVLAGQFFRRSGWDAWIEPVPGARELTATVQKEWFDVVALTVGAEKRLDELAAAIKLVRKESLNRSLGILVCGQMFVEHPELVLLVGGDMPAAGPGDAADLAQALVRAIASRD